MGYTGGKIYQQGKRFFVQLYWNGKTEKFWSVLIAGKWCAIKSRENAAKLLGAIQDDIDRDRDGFDPRSFRPGNPLCIGAYYKTWIEQITATKHTKQGYRSMMERYVIPHFGVDKDLRKFKKADLVTFQKSIQGSEKWRYNVMSALKAMVRWAYSNEEIKHVPPFPELTMGQSPEIEYLTLDQQETILSHIPQQDVPIFRFAMEYGMRIGEVRAIKRDAIKDGRVYIKRAFSGNTELRETTKTGEVRTYEITPYAKAIIDGIKTVYPFVFTNSLGNPYSNKTLNEIWHRAEKASGIRIRLYNAIRHSLGCQLLDEGQDMSFVQEVLGHKSQSMTRRYAKRTAKRVAQILTLRRCGRIEVETGEEKAQNH